MLKVTTRNTVYQIKDLKDGTHVMISGHARFCPFPVKALLRSGPKVGQGMVFTPEPFRLDNTVRTTPVEKIEEIPDEE